MDLAEATAKVKRLGATDRKPAVADADLTIILSSYRIPDVDGRRPNAAGYVDTWDLNGAIAEVWRTKAAAVAGDYNFTADDASFSKGDVLAHMSQMEAKYAGMADSDSLARIGTASTLDVSRGGGRSTLDTIASQVIP